MTVIVGLGSSHGDDRLGWIAIDRLRPLLPAGIVAHKVRDGIELLECLEGQELAIVIDAVAPAGRPGTIRLFDWPCPELYYHAPASTHGMGLVEAFFLAETLATLPRRAKIYTIEAKDTAPGDSLSPEVEHRLDAVVEAALRDALADQNV